MFVFLAETGLDDWKQILKKAIVTVDSVQYDQCYFCSYLELQIVDNYYCRFLVFLAEELLDHSHVIA